MSLFERLAALATRRPIGVCVVAVAIGLIGYLSWRELPIDLLPDLRSPTIVVSLRSGDRSPIEMERLFGERVERLLFTVQGVEEVEQVARSGRLLSTISFSWESDLDTALIDVQKAIGSLEGDPAVDELLVRRFDPRQEPILVLGLVAVDDSTTLVDLRTIARRQVAPTLEQLSGVAEVLVVGGRKEEVWVRVDQYRMDAFGITLQLLEDRIRTENIDVQAGTVEQNNMQFQVRARSRYASVEDIERVVVRFMTDNEGQRQAVRVSDVATVEVHHQEVNHSVLVDGREGVGLHIYKESGSNTVAVSKVVKDALEPIAADIPGVEIKEVADNAFLIVDALTDLQLAALAGITLAIIVLALFLRSPGATLIVATAVPVSIFAAVFFMHLAGYSLNIVTLGGLALGAGMLVDNAIVVVESMFRRVNEGDDQAEAASRGTGLVAGAIVASTLTTCVVFLPVFFVEGLAARLIDGIAFTVVVSLAASLLVAVFLIPALGRWFLPKPSTGSQGIRRQVHISGARSRLEGFVAILLRAPATVVVISIGLAGTAIYGLSQLGTEILPPGDPRQFSVRIVGPAGQRVETTVRGVEAIETVLRQAGGESLAVTMSEVGRLPEEERAIRTEMTEENTARITARMKDGTISGRTMASALAPILEELPSTELTWEVSKTALSTALGTGGPPILVEVSGNALIDIRRGTELIQEQLAELDTIWNVRSSFEGGPPELRVTLIRALADTLGVTATSVSRIIEASLDGRFITNLTIGDEEFPITLRTSETRRENLDEVQFKNQTGQRISVGQVANFDEQEGAREVYRRDQRRMAQITAEVSEDFELPDAVAAVNSVLNSTQLPPGVRVQLRGEEEERIRTFGELRLAGILAILLVFMVLAGTFESMLQPITVLSAVPLALIGTAVCLVPLGHPIGVMAMLGLIVLAGIAVNDAVLLLTTARQLMNGGMDRAEALASAAGIRLRPILMTTLTTTLALTPLLFGGGEGAVLRQPMALTIIGGLVASTIASLIVLPCLYMVLDNVSRFIRRV